MDYYQAQSLLINSGVRLMRVKNAPLLISFLSEMYKSPHRLSILQSEIESRLKDTLFRLHDHLGEVRYPSLPHEYLEQWVQDGWLRRYYQDHDEPEYELTPEVDQTLTWLLSLKRREFVGTESRLQTIFSRLREIAEGTDDNLDRRKELLERQQAEIQKQLDQLNQGKWQRLDARRIKEYWQEARETAMRLLADFREVEANFRQLDQSMRQQIATSGQNKGEVLAQLFADQDQIRESEQGQSFYAFWDFLMNPLRQAELGQLLSVVEQLPEMEAEGDPFMRKLKFNLVQAADRVKSSQNRLFTQLRRFLQSRHRLEQKMLCQILQKIDGYLLKRQEIPSVRETFWETDEFKPELNLLYERIPWRKTEIARIDTQAIVAGQRVADWTDLLQEYPLDPQLLQAHRDELLLEYERISLEQILERWPLTWGIAELLAWIQLALDDPFAHLQRDVFRSIELKDLQLGYCAKLEIPSILFTRPASLSSKDLL
jgi:hypothetical protein